MPLSTYIISVDLGTQGTKIALVTSEGLINASILKPTLLHRLHGGIVEQDPQNLMESVVYGIKELLDSSGIDGNKVVAIGLSGQMAGILGINEAGEAITPYDSWLDTRCAAYFDKIKNSGEEAYIEITGCPVTYAHGSKVLWWKHERPDVYSSINKFIMPTTYIALCLTGGRAKDAYIDYTHLHFSGFANVEQNKWSDDLLTTFNISAEKMPTIVSPWDIVGHLIPKFAALCGLPAGIPVTAGCGDTAAATLGAGITKKGMVFDVAGTASVLSCCVSTYKPDIHNKTLIFSRSVLPGLWNPLAYINGGGQCLAWFRDQLTLDRSSSTFADLNRGAEAIIPGSDGLFFIPHFNGRVCPNNALLRGAWIGLNWSHDKYAMYRSIMESIAYEYKGYLNILQHYAGDLAFSDVRVVGGGAKGDIFNQIKSDVLGIPYTTLCNNDTSHLANAAIAGFGIGLFTDLGETITNWVEVDRTTTPNSVNNQLYYQPSSNYPRLLEHMTQVQMLIEEGSR